MTSGRPGPVVLDVPFDVFMESAAEEAPNAIAWNTLLPKGKIQVWVDKGFWAVAMEAENSRTARRAQTVRANRMEHLRWNRFIGTIDDSSRGPWASGRC